MRLSGISGHCASGLVSQLFCTIKWPWGLKPVPKPVPNDMMNLNVAMTWNSQQSTYILTGQHSRPRDTHIRTEAMAFELLTFHQLTPDIPYNVSHWGWHLSLSVTPITQCDNCHWLWHLHSLSVPICHSVVTPATQLWHQTLSGLIVGVLCPYSIKDHRWVSTCDSVQSWWLYCAVPLGNPAPWPNIPLSHIILIVS